MMRVRLQTGETLRWTVASLNSLSGSKYIVQNSMNETPVHVDVDVELYVDLSYANPQG